MGARDDQLGIMLRRERGCAVDRTERRRRAVRPDNNCPIAHAASQQSVATTLTARLPNMKPIGLISAHAPRQENRFDALGGASFSGGRVEDMHVMAVPARGG